MALDVNGMAVSTARPTVSIEDACAALEPALSGDVRRKIATELAKAPTFGAALLRLREPLRTNAFHVGDYHFNFERFVNAFDRVTRRDGFHVLHDWDGKSDRVNEEIIPVDVLDYVVRLRRDDPPDAGALAVLLDYYFVHVLELMSLRVWDGDGDADRRLDRIGDLLQLLQGPGGSGQPFVDDVETLILLATSHYERHEAGYRLLLERVRTLNARHQLNIAFGHAASMGSHLRFGFEASYARDTVFMRDDNVADYPWLCYALLLLMREYSRQRESAAAGQPDDRVVEALLNGLSADARAFVGGPAASLSECERDRAEFAERFHRHQDELLERFEPLRPTQNHYSPLSFFFNFSHNVRKGTVVDALLRGDPWRMTFNDLLTGFPAEDSASAPKTLLATTLMTYARLNPDRIRGQLMPVIVYDPAAGRQAFGTTMRRLRE
jgi:hypothetical protein